MIKTASKRPVRQLPPTAVPINGRDLLGALRPSAESYSQFKASLAKTLAISPEACFLASSGRTVLYYLLKGLKSADPARPEVIIPAYTCPALAKVTLDLGLIPRFVDINPETTEYESDAISAAISTRTLAIMLVHPFGIPLPFEEISVMAREFGALVIEDAAQAMGAKWDNQWVLQLLVCCCCGLWTHRTRATPRLPSVTSNYFMNLLWAEDSGPLWLSHWS